MTTTVNQPGWGFDETPAKTTIAASEAAKDEAWGWDEPVKAPEPKKKIKTSELPLSSAQRTAVETLSHRFKKKGGYDVIRKKVWGKLEGSEFEHELMDKVKSVAISTLESNPSLLSSARKKSAILVEGHIERSEVYQEAENYIRNLIREQHIDGIEEGIRALRVAEVGEEQAAREREMGSKTDEDYAAETAKRREERERIREEERKKQEAIEAAQRLEEEKLKRIEDEKRRKESDERDAARRAKKEALAKAYEAIPGSANGEPVGTRGDRGRYDDRGSRGDRGRGSRGRGSRGRESRESSRGGRLPPSGPRIEKILSRAEQERIEKEAMAELLRDGKKASRNRYQAEPEIDETLAPPPRKAMPSSAIKPIDRDPPPKTMERKDLLSKREEIKPERPSSKFDIKREDIDRREKPRERSRDRGYSRRSSRDKDARSMRGSRDRLDRRRSRSRDGRRRDDRPYDDRDRERRSTRDARDPRGARERDTKRESRFDDRSTRRRSRTRSRSPREKVTPKPIPAIDPSRDPVLGHDAASARRFIDREAEEKKLIEIRTREAEARAFLQQREEAKARGLPMPGYDRLGIEKELYDARTSRDRQGSGTPSGLGRDPRDRSSWRGGAPLGNRDIDSTGFATPGPREKDFNGRERRGSTIDRPPSRTSHMGSRENTPIPTGPRRDSMANARASAAPRDDRRESAVPRSSPVLTRDVKTEVPSPTLTRHSRKDSTEAGEIVPGAPDLFTAGSTSGRRKSRSHSRERRREEREKPSSDSRERRRRDDRDGRRDSRRDDTRDRRDERDRRPRSRSRDRDRRYRSRSRDSRRPRDSGRSYGGRR